VFAEQRRQQVTALRDRLAEWQEGADPALIAAALARFDGYSERNAMLIAMQYPDATDVDGFRAWLDRGRCVRKRPPDVAPGEWGIKILAPAGSYRENGDAPVTEFSEPEPAEAGEDSARSRQRFKIAYVFDISQTDPNPDVVCRCGSKLRKCECGGQTCPGWTHPGRNGSHWCTGTRDLAEPAAPAENEKEPADA